MEVVENDNNAHKIKLAEFFKKKALKTEIIHQLRLFYSHDLFVYFPFQKHISK